MAPSLLRETGIWQSFFPAHTSNSLKYGNFISHLYHSENKTEPEKRQETERLIVQQRGVAEKASGEEGVNIIAALLGLGELVTNVNMPNQGQVSNLPIQAIVETNAFITRNRVQPIFSGALPKGVEMLAARHISNQEAVADAGLTKDTGLAFQAFLNDPLVRIDRSDAEQLFNDMLQCTMQR